MDADQQRETCGFEARQDQPFAPPTLPCGTTQKATERDHADARRRERRPSANAAYSQLLLSELKLKDADQSATRAAEPDQACPSRRTNASISPRSPRADCASDTCDCARTRLCARRDA
jgi:hypothetical protein